MREVCIQRILSRGKSHASHAKNEKDMQCEIDELKKKLCRIWRRYLSPDSELSSEETDNATYRQRSRTPPSETFSGNEEYRHKRKNKSPTHKGLGETLKVYSDRYWEMFIEIDGSYNDVAISTFKASLPAKHDLRKSLIGKPVTLVRLLMDRIDKYRRIEEDQLQGKGKAKVIPQERRDSRSDRIQNNRPWRDFIEQSGSANTQAINSVFRELVQQVLEKVKNEPFFRWPNKMAGDPVNRN